MASVDTCWVSSKNTHDVTSHVSTIEPFHITPQDMTLLFTSVQYVTRETHESAEGCFPVFQTGSGGVEKSKSRGKDFTARAFPLERNACFCVHSTQNACGPPHLFRNVLARFLSFSSDVPAFSRVCVVPSVKCTLLAFDYVLAKVSAFIFPEAHSAHCRCSGKNVSRRTFDFTPLMLAFNVLLPHSVAYTTVVPSYCRSNRTLTFILFKTALHCSTTNSLRTTYVPFAPGEFNPSLTLGVVHNYF